MLDNFKIGTRLRLGSGVLILLLLLVGGYAYVAIERIDTELNLVTQDKWPKSLVLDEIRNQFNRETILLNTLILTEDREGREKSFAQITAIQKHISQLMEVLTQRVNSDQGQTLLKRIETVRTDYLAQRSETIDVLRAGTDVKASSLIMNKLHRAEDAYFAAITDMSQYQNFEVDRLSAREIGRASCRERV